LAAILAGIHEGFDRTGEFRPQKSWPATFKTLTAGLAIPDIDQENEENQEESEHKLSAFPHTGGLLAYGISLSYGFCGLVHSLGPIGVVLDFFFQVPADEGAQPGLVLGPSLFQESPIGLHIV
jgi:hypothetical protein